jgi:hypothetical protein
MTSKYDSRDPGNWRDGEDANRETVSADLLICQFVSALLNNDSAGAENATRSMVNYVFDRARSKP